MVHIKPRNNMCVCVCVYLEFEKGKMLDSMLKLLLKFFVFEINSIVNSDSWKIWKLFDSILNLVRSCGPWQDREREGFLQADYDEIISILQRSSSPLASKSRKDLYNYLCTSPILIGDGALVSKTHSLPTSFQELFTSQYNYCYVCSTYVCCIKTLTKLGALHSSRLCLPNICVNHLCLNSNIFFSQLLPWASYSSSMLSQATRNSFSSSILSINTDKTLFSVPLPLNTPFTCFKTFCMIHAHHFSQLTEVDA